MRTLVILVLAVFLSACSVFGGPSLSVLRRAIAHQVELSQQQISVQFYSTPRSIPFSIRRIRVSETEKIKIKTQTAYHVTGQYDIDFRSGLNRSTQSDNAFEVYVIQSTENDEEWLLALPNSASPSPTWTFSPLS